MLRGENSSRYFLLWVLVVLGGAFGTLHWKSGAFLGPADVHFDDAAAAVRDARELIAQFRASPPTDNDRKLLNASDVAPTLRIPHLRYALVFADQVRLVIARNPDCSKGARIWSADAKPDDRDQPTAYREIGFFFVCK